MNFNNVSGKNKDILLSVLISVFAVMTRLIFFEKNFLGYDPINFIFGSISFSLTETRPHLPGYYLFVKIIELFTLIINDKHTAFLIVINIFTFLASYFSYLSLRYFFNIKISITVMLLLLFNPMVWYYGCVTEIYVFDWFLTALLIFVSFKKNGLYFVLPILALGTGFRQSSGVLLSPFAVYLFYLNYKNQKLNFKYFLYSIISAVIIFVVWFLPMVSRDGGILGYIALYSKNNPVELISLLQNWFRMSSLMLFFIAPLFIIIIAFLMKFKRIKFNEQSLSELKLLFSILIIPMLFFVFGHYSKGYILLIAFPIFAIIGILIKEKVINNLIVFTTISAEILLFVVTPYHQGDVASIVKSQVRQKSVPSVWYDRTFSNYSLTRGRIKFESEKVEKLKLLINKSTSMKFFIDPTLSFYTRVLQYYFPKRKFITLNLRNESEFFMFHKLAVNALPKEKIIMKNIMFISRNDFINSYVGFENINIINKDNSYSLFQIDKQYESKLFRIYKKLFLRL